MAVEKIISFILAGIFACISLCQFMEKGILLNNSFIFASKEERKNLDRKKYYRQSAIVFYMLSSVFLVTGLSIIFQNKKILLIKIPLLIATLIYAVISSIKIERDTKK
jgi:hypothetical protein